MGSYCGCCSFYILGNDVIAPVQIGGGAGGAAHADGAACRNTGTDETVVAGCFCYGVNIGYEFVIQVDGLYGLFCAMDIFQTQERINLQNLVTNSAIADNLFFQLSRG